MKMNNDVQKIDIALESFVLRGRSKKRSKAFVLAGFKGIQRRSESNTDALISLIEKEPDLCIRPDYSALALK